MTTSFLRSEYEGDNIHTFYFARPDGLRYTAGQFIELTVPHTKVDSRGDHRWFTLSSSPSDTNVVSITTRIRNDGSSYKHALMLLTDGDRVTISEPMGDFVLPMDKSQPLIFIMQGIGVTPLLSMHTYLKDIGEVRNIKLFGGADNFLHDFREGAWEGAAGVEELLLQPNTLIYIAGPEKFTASVQQELLATGIKPHQLVLDFFSGY